MALNTLFELIVLGSPLMLKSVVSRVAIVSGTGPTMVPSDDNWLNEYFQLMAFVAEENQLDTTWGIVELQALPGERTLVRVSAKSNVPGADKVASYGRELITELARLGFYESQDVPKDALGFRTILSQLPEGSKN